MSEETIRERIATARSHFKYLDAAIFTTFALNTDFFEENVLPVALGVEAEDQAARRAQVHEQLAEVPVSVYYDATAEIKLSGKYRYTASPVPLRDRFFHPKNVILAGRDSHEQHWVYITAASANLTLSGWGKNGEGCAEIWIHTQRQQPWEALQKFLLWLLSKTQVDGAHSLGSGAINQVLSVLNLMPSRRRFSDDGSMFWSGKLYGDLYFSPVHKKGLAQFLIAEKRVRPAKLVAYSPYWGEVSKNVARFKSNDFELIPAKLLQRDGMPIGISVAEVTSLPKKSIYESDLDNGQRFWHFKIICLYYGAKCRLAIGSCNFTKAGLQGAAGNVESMLVFDVDSIAVETFLPKRKVWASPPFTSQEENEEGIPSPAPVCVIVIFDWRLRSYRWWHDPSPVHKDITLEIPGVHPVSLVNAAGIIEEAPLPPRGGTFFVRYKVASLEQTWKGTIVEINLDSSERTYGAPLKAADILDSWKGRQFPLGTGLDKGGDGEGDQGSNSEESESDAFDTLNLYEIFRAFRDLKFRLDDAMRNGDERRVKSQLVTRPDSVLALARLAGTHKGVAAIRYLILREAANLMETHISLIDAIHFENIRSMVVDAREECKLELISNPKTQDKAENLLDWFERRLDATWGIA